MQIVRFVFGAVFLIIGLLSCIVGVIGVFKFKYAANRMHAAAINDTLGISLCMLGLSVLAPDIASALKMILVIIFFWISAPVASHLLCRLEVETNEEREQYMELHVIEGTEADADKNTAGAPEMEEKVEEAENETADGQKMTAEASDTQIDSMDNMVKGETA